MLILRCIVVFPSWLLIRIMWNSMIQTKPYPPAFRVWLDTHGEGRTNLVNWAKESSEFAYQASELLWIWVGLVLADGVVLVRLWSGAGVSWNMLLILGVAHLFWIVISKVLLTGIGKSNNPPTTNT